MNAPADTSGVRVGDPDPWPDNNYMPCCAQDYLTCTAPEKHTGQHVATDGAQVLHVWEAS